MIAICPVCGKGCGLPFPRQADFLYCQSCQVAVRRKDTIATDRSQNYKDGWVENHSNSRSVSDKVQHMTKLILGVLPIGRTVLDIGCASGLLVDRLSAAGYVAKGVDWSSDAIKFASAHMRGEFVIDDANSMSNVHGSYDAVVLSHIIEHLEQPHILLGSVSKILRPHGYLFLSVPNLSWYQEKPPWRRISSIFDTDHVAGYTLLGLIRLLACSGFSVVAVGTKTYGTDLLGAVCSAVRRATAISCSDNSAARRAYAKVESVLPLLNAVMYIPSRVSERHHGGMELTVTARAGKDTA